MRATGLQRARGPGTVFSAREFLSAEQTLPGEQPSAHQTFLSHPHPWAGIEIHPPPAMSVSPKSARVGVNFASNGHNQKWSASRTPRPAFHKSRAQARPQENPAKAV